MLYRRALKALFILMPLALFACSKNAVSSGGPPSAGSPTGSNPTPTPSPLIPLIRNDVMIVVNKNSTDGLQLGQYYAQARNVPLANIAQVYTPNSYYMSQSDFMSMRNQLLQFLIQNTLDDSTLATTNCGNGNYDCALVTATILNHTKIRYIVMTRGMPARTVFTNSTLLNAGAPASVDNYLVHYLLQPFPADTVVFNPYQRAQAFSDGRGMRTVLPSHDLELIVGRIDGLDYNSAQALIDRALDAEADGIYGNIFTSQYGLSAYGHYLQWYNFQSNQEVYGTNSNGWRYLLGIWNVSQPQCQGYWNFSWNVSQSAAPTNCGVQFSDTFNIKNGVTGSPQSNDRNGLFNPIAYMGELDGQVAMSSFSNLMSWHKNSTCTQTLCRLESDVAACQARSKDVYKEIDTDCVGVNEGFMGYNFISWPQSYFAAWPTGWNLTSSASSWGQSTLADLDGGDDGPIAMPYVVNTDGADDNFSLWFRRLNDVSNPVCYASTDLTQAPTTACPDNRYIYFSQEITMPNFNLNTATPQTYTISIETKGLNVPTSFPLYVWVGVHQQDGTTVPYPDSSHATAMMATIPTGNSNWTHSQVTFQLNPSLHTSCTTPCVISGLKLFFFTSSAVSGDLGVDMISVQDTTQNIELVTNGSFNQGHENVNTGDWGAQFLSRLGATAFWGSTGHHQSNGHSFASHIGETFIYLFRGLPLGDAVWFDEINNNGIIYGDPLYSPTAVMLHYTLTDKFNRFSGPITLIADTVNGTNQSAVTTTYGISYCAGRDFYTCDTNQTWINTALTGNGGQKNQTIGTLQATDLPIGWNVIRLSVTSLNRMTGQQQTLNDFLVVSNWGSCPIDRFPVTSAPTDASWDDANHNGIIDPCDGDVLGGATWVTTGSNDTLASLGYSFYGYTNVQYLNGTFVTADNYNGVQYSTDGVTWHSVALSENSGGTVSISIAGNYFIATSGTSFISYSSDGIHWTDMNPLIGSTATTIVFGGGRYLAWNSDLVSFTSTDMVTWTDNTAWPFACAPGKIVFGDKFVAACSGVGYFGVSPDGKTWTQTRPATTTAILRAIAYSNNTYVAVGSSSEIQTSPDGITWTEKNTGGTNNLTSVACNGSTCIATGSLGLLRTSDMQTWSTATASGGYTGVFSSVTFGGGKFVAVGNKGMIQTSPDGITWTVQTGAYINDIYFSSLRYLNSSFVAVGSTDSGSPVVQTSSDGVTWATKSANLPSSYNAYDVAFGNGVYVVVGDTAGISTSTDLNTFTTQTPASTTQDFYAVAYNATIGRFLAGGSSGNLQYSSDGVHWTAANLSSTDNISAIQISNGNFVVVSGNTVKYSANGTSWTTAVSSNVYNSGIVCHGLTCIVTSQSNSFLRSIDGGQTFTNVTTPISNYSWQGAFADYAGGTWYATIALSNTSYVYTSTDDGVTWAQKSHFTYNIYESQISGAFDGTHYFMPTASGMFLRY